MARDDLKQIIERGRQIPEHGSPITTKTKDTMKAAKAALLEQPKLRKAVNAHRTIRGVRR